MSWLWIAKVVGSVFIMVSSTMVGYAFSRRLTERVVTIREIQGFLMELENEIHFMGRPLGQALLSFSNSRSGKLAQFCREVSQMQSRENTTIESAWNNSLALFREQWSLAQEEWDLFLSIGEVLGKTDRASQCSFIQMMRGKFTIQEKKAEEDRVRKEKLYKNLGTLGGLALVLILI